MSRVISSEPDTGHLPVGRATKGSTVRQRSTRRKPLYLLTRPRELNGVEAQPRTDWARLDVPRPDRAEHGRYQGDSPTAWYPVSPGVERAT